MTWLTQALPAGLVVLALLWLPGLGALRAVGLRGLLLWSGAPAVSLAGYAVATQLVARLGLAWRPVSGIGATLVVLVVLALVGRLVLGRTGAARVVAAQEPFAVGGLRGEGRAAALALGLVLAGGALLVLVPTLLGMHSAQNPLQQWDGVFHLDGIRLIQDTGDATGLDGLYGSDVHVFYPATWHALMALVPGTHGLLPWVSIPAATSAWTLVCSSIVWPLVVAGWCWVVLPGRRMLLVVAVALLGAFPMFPTVLWSIQAVWPNGTSILVLPGAAALWLLVLRVLDARGSSAAAQGPRDGAGGARAVTGLTGVALVATLGLAAAHPTGAVALIVLVGPLAAWRVWRAASRRWRAGRRAGVVVMTGAVLVLGAVAVARASQTASWASVTGYERPFMRPYSVTVLRLLLDFVITAWPANLVVSAAVLVGVVVAWRQRLRWVVVAWALTLALAALAAGWENPLRAVTGIWYKQAMRIEAFYPVTAVLLAALGATTIAAWVARRVRGSDRTGALLRGLGAERALGWRLPGGAGGARTPVGALAWLLLVSLVVSLGYQAPARERFFAQSYQPARLKWGTMATADELDLLRRLPAVLGPGAVVIGSPYSGLPLGYGLSGLRSVYLQLGAGSADPARAYLRSRFRDIHSDPQVCAYLQDLGVTHFYDDRATPGADHAWDGKDAPGFDDVDVSTGFVPVAGTGPVTVYRITACDAEAPR